MDKETFFNLLDKYQDGTASASEKALVEEYYRRLESMGKTALTDEQHLAIKETMYRQIMAAIAEAPATVIPMRQKIYRRVAAAAAILILFSIAGYFLVFNKGAKKEAIVKMDSVKDVEAPKATKAYITLSDGQKIYLDSLGNGLIASEGGMTINKQGDQVIYSGSGLDGAGLRLNTITVPNGSKALKLLLSDGSEMWLDAGTTVTYPNAFTGKERKVEISYGQAYFEVAHNPSMPFIAKKGDAEVRVLGTHFNVSAFDNEDMKVTLLEGSVKVGNQQSNVAIKPGQQAQLVKGQLSIVSGVDVEEVMAWKNGWFEFDNTSLVAIMRQISRWYDLDIVYEGKPDNQKFGGRISKDLPLSSVLRSLETNSNGITFRIEGKIVYVK